MSFHRANPNKHLCDMSKSKETVFCSFSSKPQLRGLQFHLVTSSSTKSTSLVASSPKSEQVATLFFPASTPPTVASHPHSCSCIAPAGARLCCVRMHRRESASSGREQLVRLDATEQTTGIQAGVYCPLHLFGDLFE